MKWLWFSLLLLPLSLEAKIFSNQFIEFQLPDNWRCQLDGSEWVCQSVNEEKKRDAIIVLAAKIRKVGMDDLQSYTIHLKQPQSYTSPSGKSVISKPRYVKQIVIAGKKWIDALHLDSEIPDFFTRYLATVEADLGILLTFSVRKDKYDEYATDIEGLVRSLKAFRKPGSINATAEELAEPDDIEDAPDLVFPEDKPCKKGYRRHPTKGCIKARKKRSSDEEDMMPVLLLIVVLGGAAFYIYKKKKAGR